MYDGYKYVYKFRRFQVESPLMPVSVNGCLLLNKNIQLHHKYIILFYFSAYNFSILMVYYILV